MIVLFVRCHAVSARSVFTTRRYTNTRLPLPLPSVVLNFDTLVHYGSRVLTPRWLPELLDL